MGIKTVPQPPYIPDLAPCDFCLFPKLRGYRYERIEETKEAVTKVIDTLTQTTSMGPSRSCWISTTSTFQLEDITSMWTRVSCVCTINKSAYTKKSRNLFNDPRTISHLFTHIVCSVWPIDRTLSVPTTLGQSGARGNGCVGVLHISRISKAIISSSSYRAGSTDIPDPLSPLLPIVHRLR